MDNFPTDIKNIIYEYYDSNEHYEKFKERLIPFPDLTFQLDRSVIEGNRAAIGYTMIGKQTGNYNYKLTEIAASNKSIQVREAQFLEFNSYGKINSIIVVSNENDIISIIK